MKRIILVGITLMIIFCNVSCNKEKEDSVQYLLDEMFYTEEYLPEYDAPPDYFESRERIAKKGTIYYIYSYSTMYLYYYDESTGVSGKLCGKAECMHDNTDCNAYMPFSMNFQIYNGYIYWLEDGNALYRCDMTGNNREIVQYLVDERVIFR